MRLRHLLLGVVLLGFAASATAADPLTRTELDKRVVAIVYDAETVGVELWKAEKHNDCLRIYQATLMALSPLLDHRPELMAKIKAGFEKTKEMATPDAAFVYRKILDEISSACGGTTKTAESKTPLWDRLGGGDRRNSQDTVRIFLGDVINAAAADPKVNFLRNGQYKLDEEGKRKLLTSLVQMVSTATGGPKFDLKEMKSVHAGMKITSAEFDALTDHLLAVLNKYKVKKEDADELMAIVVATKNEIVAPLWDRLGGEKIVKPVVIEFLSTASKDPKVNIDRGGNYPLTKDRIDSVTNSVVDFISSVTGGPLKYTGRDMKNAHQGDENH